MIKAAKKKSDIPVIRERVVVLENDGQGIEILTVTSKDDERILAGDMAIPIQDVDTRISPHGRVFVLNAPTKYVDETKHLASLEMSTVIRQAVNYQRPGVASKPDSPIMKLLPWILAALMLLLWVIKK